MRARLARWLRRGVFLAAGMATAAWGQPAQSTRTPAAEAVAESPQVAVPSPRELLTRDRLWSMYENHRDFGATVTVPEGNGMVIYMGVALGSGANPTAATERKVGHLEKYKGRYVVGTAATVVGGTALGVIGNNTDLFGASHYGRGTEAEQTQARRDTGATQAGGNTVSVKVDQSGEGEKRSDIRVYIGNIFAGKEAGEI